MSRKIIYVFNPISGSRSKHALLKKVEALTTARNLHYEFFTADANGDYKALKEKIEHEKITDIIIIGGDGTVNQVTSALRYCNVKFGIIPAGSGNGLALTAGISKNTERALEVIFNESSKKTDAFMVGNYYACMLSGLGFDATIAHKFAAHPRRGLVTYAQQSMLHFFKRLLIVLKL